MNLWQYTHHRPWPLPKVPWVLFQSWRHNVFQHWVIDPHKIRPLLPKGLTLDTYEGNAWLSVVLLEVTKAHPRWLPPLPMIFNCLQINIRTYVLDERGKPGVYFLRIGTDNSWAKWGMKLFYQLPTERARISLKQDLGGWSYHIMNEVHKTDEWQLHAKYQPCHHIFQAEMETLEYWLTERYCMYNANSMVAEIHHQPWRLQQTEYHIHTQQLPILEKWDLLRDPDLVILGHEQETVIWPPVLHR